MSSGIIIHLDNDKKGVLDPSENLFKGMGFPMEYITCVDKDQFEEAIRKYDKNIKCLIFDLLSKEPSKGELHKGDAEFLENIEKTYASFNIPIFIYSGYLNSIEGRFENYGTVFKVDKGGKEGIESVFQKIKLFHDSGFLDIFCPDGILERELHIELHGAFVKQFNANTQIENIIIPILKEGGNARERIEKIFKRIAVRSLLSGLLAPATDENGKILPEMVNPIEHYLQRISPIDVWTGDIFRSKKDKTHLLIITPRCNVAKPKIAELLVCEIIIGEFPEETSSKEGKEKIGYLLNDNPLYAGYDRYLPPSPVFEGGKVVISKYHIIDKSSLLSDFERVISLSDELTNEILGKFGAHFFRTGITPWDKDEVIAQVPKNK